MADDVEIIGRVRQASGIAAGAGPDGSLLATAVKAFVAAFDRWYIRVMRGAVPKYRSVVIPRINPFIRRFQYAHLDCPRFAARVVDDYNSRNFVTAGGWAIEAIPPAISLAFQKSAARGIDVQRSDPGSGEHHLYVMKSGPVTRNSDIVNTLKRHSREAERLLRQSGTTTKVHLNYVIAAGKNTSTFKDGVNRPSSAEFWAEVTGLQEKAAVDLVLAVALVAGQFVERDATEHVRALETLVGTYLASSADPMAVDWDYMKVRLFQPKAAWVEEDKRRHRLAVAALKATGYGQAAEVAAEADQDEPEAGEELPDDQPPDPDAD